MEKNEIRTLCTIIHTHTYTHTHTNQKQKKTKQTNKQNPSKWIECLNVRPNTIKLCEESISGILFDINHSKIFFD